MTGNKGFSVDDILNEIGSSDNHAKNTVNDDFDIDEILNYKPNKTTAPSNVSDPPASAGVKSKKPNKPHSRGKIDAEPNKGVKERPIEIGGGISIDDAGQIPPKKVPENNKNAFKVEKLIKIDDAPPPAPKKTEKMAGKKIAKTAHNNISGTSVKDARSNDALLESLRRKKASQHGTDHTIIMPPVKVDKSDSFKLSMDYRSKALPDTAKINLDHPLIEQQKMVELRERRKRKIRDFVLVSDDVQIQDEIETDEGDVAREIDDYNNYEDTGAIINDLNQIKISLLMRFFMLFFMGGASLYIAAANEYGLPLLDFLTKAINPESYMYTNIILGVLSSLVCYTVLSSGFSNLISLKADSDSICALAMVSSILSAIIMLFNSELLTLGNTNIYITVAIYGLLFNTVGKLLIVSRTKRNFRFVSGDSEKYSMSIVEDEDVADDITRGTMTDFPHLATMRKTDFLTDFLKNSYSLDYSDHLSRRVTPIILILSIAFAILSYIKTSSLNSALSAFTAITCIGSPFATMLIANIPLSRASKKLMPHSSVILGHSTIENFAETNSVLIDAAQLFPEGSIDLIGFKIFGDTKIDDAFLDAASLAIQAQSVLSHMFFDIIAGKKNMLRPVESYMFEDSLGLSGWIEGRKILLGNRELMINHSIEIPHVDKENRYAGDDKSVLYLSISGELAALFIIELKPNFEVKVNLKEIEKEEIYLMLRTVDSIISITKLAEMFDVSPNIFKILPFRMHDNFEKNTSYLPRQNGSLANNGRFASVATSLVTCNRIRRNILLSSAFNIASIILGVLLVGIFIALSALDNFSATTMLLYNFAWTFIIIIVGRIKKC